MRLCDWADVFKSYIPGYNVEQKDSQIEPGHSTSSCSADTGKEVGKVSISSAASTNTGQGSLDCMQVVVL